MVTDRPPRSDSLREEFARSDRLNDLKVPEGDRLQSRAKSIQAAMALDQRTPVKRACSEFVSAAADFYEVTQPELRILEARPLRVREGGWATELFGDYDMEKKVIRVWMRTAVRNRVTSYGTLLSTLCHEFCHHLDCELFGFRDTPHTRGFYERAAVLYHHARGTPRKPLYWAPLRGGRWRIDWPRTNRGR